MCFASFTNESVVTGGWRIWFAIILIVLDMSFRVCIGSSVRCCGSGGVRIDVSISSLFWFSCALWCNLSFSSITLARDFLIPDVAIFVCSSNVPRMIDISPTAGLRLLGGRLCEFRAFGWFFFLGFLGPSMMIPFLGNIWQFVFLSVPLFVFDIKFWSLFLSIARASSSSSWGTPLSWLSNSSRSFLVCSLLVFWLAVSANSLASWFSDVRCFFAHTDSTLHLSSSVSVMFMSLGFSILFTISIIVSKCSAPPIWSV